MKKIGVFLTIVILSFLLISCDFTFFPLFEFTSETTENYYTRVNGTITFDNDDYFEYSSYNSPTNDLTDVEEYQEVLLNTQEHIRRANIFVNMVIYTQTLPWNNSNEREVVSGGSGFVFMKDDNFFYAITNYHVIETDYNDAIVEIMAFNDSEFQEAEIIAYSPEYDLAVLKFAINNRTDVEIIDIYERLYYKFNPGELVFAVGNPSSLVNTVSFGQFIELNSLESVSFYVIRHDAAISSGSSGGVLVDVDGNFLGVNTWGIESTEILSFAIPNYVVYTFLVNEGILD